MNYYEINMECMKQFRLKFYEKLQASEQYIDVNKLDFIQSEPAKNSELFLTIGKDGKNYRLVSSFNPQHEAKKWLEQYSFHNINAVITLFGFGTGSFVREIMKNRGPRDVLFIYEPCPELFLHVIHNYDITDIIKEKNFVLAIEGVNEFEFHNLMQNSINITNITSQIRCSHPEYDKVFPESAIKYWSEIKDNHIHARLNINTEMFFGKRYITNAVFNARYLKESNRLLDYQADFNFDIPAIIVAAGPSLKKNIDELKRAKGHAYIFVVDRILDYVLEEGLEPDFVVTIDPIKPIEFFTKREDVTIPLLCELVSNWEVLDRHKGKKIIFSCVPFFQKMYSKVDKKPPTLTTGASVATTAFAACVQLGFKRIVLVGQDLAYDGEFTHAGGVAEKIARTRDVMVEGVGGGLVRSRSDWYEFLVWFKDMLILYPDLEVIDTKDKGAKIQGSINLPLKEVIDTYCKGDTRLVEILKNKENTFDDTDMLKVRQYFLDSYEELNKLKRKAKEAIELCENQIRIFKRNHIDTPESEKNFQKISKINKFISEQSIYLLLETYITSSSAQQISELYQFSDDEKTNKITTYEKSISIFRSIIEGVDFVKQLLDDMMEEI